MPVPVADLACWQRGATLVAQFHAPVKTTEGAEIKLPYAFDVRIGPGPDPFDVERWAAAAARVEGVKVTNGVALVAAPLAPWVGKEVVVAVRVAGGNGKFSNWSNYAVVEVAAPLPQPANLRAQANPEGVRLSWEASAPAFRVYRREGDAASAAVAEVAAREWQDANTDFGKRYSYSVEAFLKQSANREARSEVSAEVSITPQDQFPPAAPTGLRANAATGSVELVWEPNQEAYLGAYRVYRAAGAGAFEKLADVGQIPNYSDRAVEPGKTYRYQISAVSRTGHESPRSAAVEVALP